MLCMLTISADDILRYFLIFLRLQALTFHANCLLQKMDVFNFFFFLGGGGGGGGGTRK